MRNIYSGYIKSPFTPKKNSIRGVIIHNDAGGMTPSQYLPWLNNRVRNGQATLGFASLYVNRNECLWFSPTDHAEWHAGHQNGNYNYIGFEVCESMPSKTSNATFLQNEEATLKVVADVMKSYNLPVNRNTVMLHNEFSSTACPHRSWEIHIGKGAPYNQTNKNKLKDYFISRIKHYMNGSTATSNKKKITKKTNKPVAKKPAKKKKIAWDWAGTFTANTTIAVRKLKKGQTIPSLTSTLVGKDSYIYKGQWVNWDRLYYIQGYWWVRFKYPTNPSAGYFYMTVGKKESGITFGQANSKNKLWGKVTNMKTKEGNTKVTNWSKKGSIK